MPISTEDDLQARIDELEDELYACGETISALRDTIEQLSTPYNLQLHTIIREDYQSSRPKCPDCKGLMNFILNERMDEQVEEIPVCPVCKKAWREADLGWHILPENYGKAPQ